MRIVVKLFGFPERMRAAACQTMGIVKPGLAICHVLQARSSVIRRNSTGVSFWLWHITRQCMMQQKSAFAKLSENCTGQIGLLY